MIRFACPLCHKGFQVEERLAGRKAKCPNCNGAISIPLLVTSQPSPHAASESPPQVPTRPTADVIHGSSAPIATRGLLDAGVQAGTPQPATDADAGRDEKSQLGTRTKVALGACGALALIAVGWMIWVVVTEDTWERDNRARILAKLEEADRLQESDPYGAYKAYDDVLKESQQHEVRDEQFLKKLADAEGSRTETYQKLQEKQRAEAAEKQRLAEEERNAAATEKQRLAEEEERKRAAEEARLAEENRRKEAIAAQQKAQDAVRAAYRNAPQSGRTAMNVVKKVAARTEIGINYKDYSTVVGEAWAEVKVFTESPEGKAVPAFSLLLISAMDKHRLALDVWRGQFDGGTTGFTFDEGLSSLVIKECWRAADCRIDTAEALISNDDLESAFSRVAQLRKADETYETTVRSLFDFLKGAQLILKYAEGPEDRQSYEKTMNRVVEKIKTLIEKDSGSEAH